MKIIATIALFLTALIWGVSYSAQAAANEFLQPLVFVCLRYLIGTVLVLIPAFAIHRKLPDRRLVTGGIACGICLAGGEILQQFGLLYTSAGKTGFLTALYVVMIPVIAFARERKFRWRIWSAAVLSVLGSYLLCASDMSSKLNAGDLLVLLCAVCFAFQFIAIAEFAPKAEPLMLSGVQFFTVAVISGVTALVAGETWHWQNITAGYIPLLYCGVIAIGIACTVQIAAQKFVAPATSSIILSTASVFAILGGWLWHGETYSLRDLSGCAIILLAVILVQLPHKKAGK